MKRFKPVLLIGLGKFGNEIAETVHAVVRERNPELAAVTACLGLREQGEFYDGPTTRGKVENLVASLEPGVFCKNFNAVQACDKTISDVLADRLLGLRPQQIILDLQDKGYRVDEGVNVYLVTALSDPVGSSALIPFVGFLQALLLGRLRGMPLQLDVLAFFPDLFEQYKANDLAYARAYTTLRELDLVAEKPSLLVPAPRGNVHYTYLFTARNEDGVETGGYRDLAFMVGEVVSLLLEGKVAADASFSMSLWRTIDTKRTRFSSVGLSRLVFPKAAVMKAFADYCGANILDTGALVGPATFDRQRVAADVKDLVIGQKLDRLNERMRHDRNGREFWTDFVYSGSTGEQVLVDQFLEDLAAEASEYERTTLNTIHRAVAERRDQLAVETTDALSRSNAQCIDSREKGLYYAQAMLDVLLNRPSPYTHGDDPIEPYSFEAVRRESTRFFDTAFGIDRDLPARLKRDLDAKRQARDRHARSLEQKAAAGSESSEKQTIDALKMQIDRLDKEIKDLDTQHADAAAKVIEFDLKMADASERRRLLETGRAGDQEQRENLEKTLRGHDTQYRAAAAALDDLYERRRQLGVRLVFVYPALLLALVAVVAFLAIRDLDLPAIWTRLTDNLQWVAVVFALYGAGAFIHYWLGIRREVEAGVANVEKWKVAKRGALVALQTFRNRLFRRDFDHLVHDGLFTWVSQLERHVSDTAGSLHAFIVGLEKLRADSRTAFDSVVFPNTVLCRSVVTKASIDRLISENTSLAVEQARFFSMRSVSAYFGDYRASGSLASLTTAFKAFADDLFAGVRAKAIEEFTQDEEAAGRVRTEDRLNTLVDSSKAFVHLDVERGMDKSENLVYLGVTNADSSHVNELVVQHDRTVTPFSTGDDQGIVVCKLKVAFPAFHVGLVGYGRRLAQGADARQALYANPEWNSPDLIPSLYTLGDQDDEARCQLCLGLALGLVEGDRVLAATATAKDRRGLAFENEYLGASVEEGVELLRSFDGRALRSVLTEAVNAAKTKPGALDRLREYRQSLTDPIDAAIVDRAIGELDALV
jgi:hypothetical protein